VAFLIQLFGAVDAKRFLEQGKQAAFTEKAHAAGGN